MPSLAKMYPRAKVCRLSTTANEKLDIEHNPSKLICWSRYETGHQVQAFGGGGRGILGEARHSRELHLHSFQCTLVALQIQSSILLLVCSGKGSTYRSLSKKSHQLFISISPVAMSCPYAWATSCSALKLAYNVCIRSDFLAYFGCIHELVLQCAGYSSACKNSACCQGVRVARHHAIGPMWDKHTSRGCCSRWRDSDGSMLNNAAAACAAAGPISAKTRRAAFECSGAGPSVTGMNHSQRIGDKRSIRPPSLAHAAPSAIWQAVSTQGKALLSLHWPATQIQCAEWSPLSKSQPGPFLRLVHNLTPGHVRHRSVYTPSA